MSRAVTAPLDAAPARHDRLPVLALLVRRELQDLLVRARTRVVIGLIVTAMALTAVIYGARYPVEQRAYGEARTKYQSALEAARDVNGLAGMYHPAIKPPWRLAFVADGGQLQSPNVDRRAINAFFRPSFARLRPYSLDDGPSAGLALGLDERLSETEPLDWMFVIRVILSLAAFVLGYDALCGRRQRALLRLTLSYTVDRGQALIAKLLALWVCLAVPFLVGAGLSLLIIAGFGGIEPRAGELAKIAVVLLLGLLGGAFFVLIALLVSALARSAARALSTLALVWVAAVVAIPAAAALAAQVVEPLRPPEVQPSSPGSWRPPEWAAEDEYAAEKVAAEVQRRRRARDDQERRRFVDAQFDQVELACDLASLSPMFLVQELAQRLVGSGTTRDRAFVEQARVFEVELKTRIEEIDRRDPDSPHLFFFPRYLSRLPIDSAEVPRFSFREPSLAAGMAEARWHLLLLLLEIAAVALLLQFSFVRDHLR